MTYFIKERIDHEEAKLDKTVNNIINWIVTGNIKGDWRFKAEKEQLEDF